MHRHQNNNPAWYQQPWLWVIIAVLVIGILGIFVSAMGLPHFGSSNSKSSKTTSVKKKTSSDKFDGKSIDKKDYKITINKISTQTDPDDSSKEVIVFDYTVHNKTGKDINADSAWQETFEAFQPTKNVERSLHIATLDDDDGSEFDQIRKDGTTQAKFAYEIKNTHRPVLLKAYDQDGDVIGKHSYKLKAAHSSDHNDNSTIVVVDGSAGYHDDSQNADSDSSSDDSSSDKDKVKDSDDQDNSDDYGFDNDNDNNNGGNSNNAQSNVDSPSDDW